MNVVIMGTVVSQTCALTCTRAHTHTHTHTYTHAHTHAPSSSQGEYIDLTIGAALSISTMAAAGLGNLISDLAGLGLADRVSSQNYVFTGTYSSYLLLL